MDISDHASDSLQLFMAAPILARVGDSWVKVGGEVSEPRNIFVVDKVGKHLIDHVHDHGIEEKDQVVQFQFGSFENIREYFISKSKQHGSVEAVIMLWIGMEELSQEIPEHAQSPPSHHFHPRGPRIYPRHEVTDVVESYHCLVKAVTASAPKSLVLSTAPAPRRSAGFATFRSDAVWKNMTQQTEKHHHIGVRQGFVMMRKGANGSQLPGGRRPINEDRFLDDGIVPENEFLEIIIRRVYAALSVFKGKETAFPESLTSTVLRF